MVVCLCSYGRKNLSFIVGVEDCCHVGIAHVSVWRMAACMFMGMEDSCMFIMGMEDDCMFMDMDDDCMSVSVYLFYAAKRIRSVLHSSKNFLSLLVC